MDSNCNYIFITKDKIKQLLWILLDIQINCSNYKYHYCQSELSNNLIDYIIRSINDFVYIIRDEKYNIDFTIYTLPSFIARNLEQLEECNGENEIITKIGNLLNKFIELLYYY